MNQDTFVEARSDVWHNLERILKKIEREGLKSLETRELRDIGHLYQCVCSDLAYARTRSFDSDLLDYLNRLVARTYAQIYSPEPYSLRQVGRFFSAEFPALFRRSLPFILAAALIFLFAGLGVFLVIRHNPASAVCFLPERILQYVEKNVQEKDAGQVLQDEQKPFISGYVMNNNVLVGFQAFAWGISLGLVTIYILLVNGALLGALAAIYHSADLGVHFWSLILPHGVIELFSIFVCGGAGLILGWSILRPGEFSRLDSLRSNGGMAVQLAIGVIPLLIIAALIEGFVTPLRLSDTLKLAFSGLTAIGLSIYVIGKPGAKRSGRARDLSRT